MKSTEKNEKSPKKFNGVDFAILVILILLIAGVVWKLATAKEAANKEADTKDEIAAFESSEHMRYTVECVNIPVSAAKNIVETKDTQLFNNNLDLSAFITDSTYEPTTYTITNADGTQATVSEPDTCNLTITVEAVYDAEKQKDEKAFTVGSQELRVGKSYILKTKSIEITGYITSMEVVNE